MVAGVNQRVGVFFVCRFPVMNQRLVFVILLSPGHEIRRVQGAEALGSAAQHAPSVAQLVLGLFKHDPPLIQKDDVIRHLLQVAGDVRGDQHGVLLVLHEVPQQVQNIVSHHRVQPAGSVVQHQQPGPCRKRVTMDSFVRVPLDISLSF